MPIYEVEINGRMFEVDAPSLRAAVTAAKRRQGGPASREGSPLQRFATNAGEMLNPVTAAKGLYQAARHPIDTGRALVEAQIQQYGKAGERFGEGRPIEAAGHLAAGIVPIIGPLAAEAGEQAATGDIAGAAGKATGILAPVGVRPTAALARRAVPAGARSRAASSLERGAAARVVDVMAPKVGPNKTRFGGQAQKVAPQIAKDLARDGAPLTREGLHAQVGGKLAEAETALDAASDARLAARSFDTQPLIDALLAKRRTLTAEAVDASTLPRGTMARDAGPITTNQIPAPPTPLGTDVVPGPNAARVAVIDRAIEELRQLGPVTRYEPIRRIRQAYDGPAKAVYSPSMTADYLKAQGGKLGAADVTGTLRDTLAKWDPNTAAANADYSVYRAADDVMQATAEVERVRPRVGRQIMARLTGTLMGQQAAGVPGAVAGYLGGPLVDAALSAGMTTKLTTARLMQRMADAIRSGQTQQVEGLLSLMRKELRVLGPVQAGRVTSPANPEPPIQR